MTRPRTCATAPGSTNGNGSQKGFAKEREDTSTTTRVDMGHATAAQIGVSGPESGWLMEGHGVDPDIVVDNLPHATFKGEDAQLKAAVEHLQKLIKEKPVETPAVPKFPGKK